MGVAKGENQLVLQSLAFCLNHDSLDSRINMIVQQYTLLSESELPDSYKSPYTKTLPSVCYTYLARIKMIYRIKHSIAKIVHILKIPKILDILIQTRSKYICNQENPLIKRIGVQTKYIQLEVCKAAQSFIYIHKKSPLRCSYILRRRITEKKFRNVHFANKSLHFGAFSRKINQTAHQNGGTP
jgi:hypothetical protein